MRVSFIAATVLAVATAVLAVPSQHHHEGVVARRAIEADQDSEFLPRDEELELRGKKSWLATDGTITYYAGNQLDAPACGGKRPTDDSLICAVNAKAGIACGSQIHIHYGGKVVSVTVVDHCAGCKPHHLDLSKGAFKALAPLSLGLINGIHFRVFP